MSFYQTWEQESNQSEYCMKMRKSGTLQGLIKTDQLIAEVRIQSPWMPDILLKIFQSFNEFILNVHNWFQKLLQLNPIKPQLKIMHRLFIGVLYIFEMCIFLMHKNYQIETFARKIQPIRSKS